MSFSMYIQKKSPTYILPSCRSWWLSMRDTRLWRLPWQCIGVPRTNWRPVGLWWGGPNRPAKRGWGQGSVTMETLKKGENQFKARIMCWYLPQTAVHFKSYLLHQCMKKKKEMFMNTPCKNFTSHQHQFISNTFLWLLSIYGITLLFFMNIPRSSTTKNISF